MKIPIQSWNRVLWGGQKKYVVINFLLTWPNLYREYWLDFWAQISHNRYSFNILSFLQYFILFFRKCDAGAGHRQPRRRQGLAPAEIFRPRPQRGFAHAKFFRPRPRRGLSPGRISSSRPRRDARLAVGGVCRGPIPGPGRPCIICKNCYYPNASKSFFVLTLAVIGYLMVPMCGFNVHQRWKYKREFKGG